LHNSSRSLVHVTKGVNSYGTTPFVVLLSTNTALSCEEGEYVLMKLKCVIFDMDGTLTQTNQLIFESFNHVAQQYRQKRYSEQEILAMFGPPEEVALMEIVTEEQLQEAMQEYLGFYRNNHHRMAKLYPGIAGLLDELKSREYIVALFTGKGRHTTNITLEELNLVPYFDCVVTGNDVVHHKPSGEGIQKILSQFTLHQDEAIMVGDSVADIKASREAGVRVASVVWDSYAKDNVMRLNAENLFTNVDDLRRWLDAHDNSDGNL
jgi:pyrophosphatase PpaX